MFSIHHSWICICMCVFSTPGCFVLSGKVSQKHWNTASMWFNCSRTGMCGAVCVSVSVCELVPCNCSVTLPSFLLFSNPSCMGQHMERASIWAPSPAYLLDTQVGTTHSSPLSTPLASFFVTFFYPPCELSALCVCNVAWSSSWNNSHMWEMLSVLSCIAALCCVTIWSTGLGRFG